MSESWLRKIPHVVATVPQARWEDGTSVTRLAVIGQRLELAIEYKGTIWIVDLGARTARISKSDPRTL